MGRTSARRAQEMRLPLPRRGLQVSCLCHHYQFPLVLKSLSSHWGQPYCLESFGTVSVLLHFGMKLQVSLIEGWHDVKEHVQIT